MEKVVKQAIETSWKSFQFEHKTSSENGHTSHDFGWKEGYEWILCELVINKEIFEDVLKKYMNKLNGKD